MYWFRRPPYLRWSAAALVVAGALWMDFREAPTEQRPFAITPIAAGTRVEANMIDYRDVPTGLLPEVTLGGSAVSSIAPGEPITQAMLTDRGTLPDGWWALEMEVPSGIAPGTELRLVVENDASTVVPGIVTGVIAPDPLVVWSEGRAMVAVPADQAAIVATALAQTQLSVLVAEW